MLGIASRGAADDNLDDLSAGRWSAQATVSSSALLRLVFAMPQFNVTVPHTLSREDARAKLEKFSEFLQQKFQGQVKNVEESWEGDTLNFAFRTYGINLKGNIAVNDSDLKLTGEIPFSAMMFRGKIESAIREQLENLVGGSGAAGIA